MSSVLFERGALQGDTAIVLLTASSRLFARLNIGARSGQMQRSHSNVVDQTRQICDRRATYACGRATRHSSARQKNRTACHTGFTCAGGVTHALAPRNLGRTGHDVRPFQASWPCLARTGGVIHAPSPRNFGRAGRDRDPSGRCGRALHGQHTSRWPGGRRAVAIARWGWDTWPPLWRPHSMAEA